MGGRLSTTFPHPDEIIYLIDFTDYFVISSLFGIFIAKRITVEGINLIDKGIMWNINKKRNQGVHHDSKRTTKTSIERLFIALFFV
jgi:hypothetical protein